MADSKEKQQADIEALDEAIDTFDEAWDSFSDEGEPTTPEEGVATNEDDAAKQLETPAAEPAQSAEPDWKARAEQAEHKMHSWEGRLSKADRENQELRQRLKEMELPANADPDREGKPPEQDTGESAPGPDTDTGEKLAARLREEFGDELGGDLAGHITRQQKTVAELQARLGTDLEGRITPLERAHKEATDKAHVQRLDEAHPDWRDVAQSSEFGAWIDAQPGYIAQAMRQVTQSGSTEDSIALLSQYKSSQSKGQTRAKAEQARAVSARSGGPPRGQATDFESAWDEF